MARTDDPNDNPEVGLSAEPPEAGAQSTVPTIATLRWPIVQVLRDVGQASDAELVELVADSLRLTDQQRAEMIPSGQETRLRNRVSWAAHELKQIGAVYYPKPSFRALTAVGHEIDDDQIKDLHRAFEAEERRRKKAKKKVAAVAADTQTAWLIRAGGRGEHAESFIKSEIAAVGFGRLGDLSEVSSRDEMVELVKEDWPESSDREVGARADQLWAFRSEIRRGDLVVTPRRTNSSFALGTVTGQYWYRHHSDTMRHAVSVNWKPNDVPRTAVRQDLLESLSNQRYRRTVNSITSEEEAWRLHQLLETGRDPGPRVDAAADRRDLSALVERFRAESGYPTEAHQEQDRLRAEWAEKLAPENVGSLTREDLAAYVSFSVDYGEGEYVKPGARVHKWILDLDDTQYDRLLDSIRDLCWGSDELPTRIDRLVDESGASRKDTGTRGFGQGNLNATLAICHPDKFLPIVGHGGKWGFKPMLHTLGLPEPGGSTYGQQVVDANDRLREHLVPHLGDDPQAIGCFLYWLIGQEADSGGDELDEAADLSALVEQFRAETDYPTAAHEEQQRLRAEWAEKLSPETIKSLSREDLTAFTNHAVNNGEYVRRVRGVMRWISDLGEPEFDNLLDNIEYLCWGDDELSVRFDQLYVGDSPRKVKGYAGVNISRTLAICHPDSFLPVHRNVGNWGRAKMLRELGLPAPLGTTPGQRVVDANNRLLEHLEPHFGDDTLAMGAFFGWLLNKGLPAKELPNGPMDLTELADELLVDVQFLEDIVSLLQDKGQVILYGPPGTGKTYLARKLAAELAPDESCRVLVQFHPSTSYEDFFEGYRPAGTSNDGGIRYILTPGPLARMTKRAAAVPAERHVMIIDEINRGNLPRVLGELLFLLEYRDESVQTLYRPEEPFSLPDNLWFIGTMNTADRSIALVDAALRRRFHFVPFFPDSGPMEGLLGRWLERQNEPAWVGHLVDTVNDELKKELGGSHLLLGPSHFMKKYGSSPQEQRERLRRIWEYNIEPFIEDQFFGDPDQIAHFRFDAVMRRKGPAAKSDVDADDDSDAPESTNGPDVEHAAADGDAAAEPGTTPESER